MWRIYSEAPTIACTRYIAMTRELLAWYFVRLRTASDGVGKLNSVVIGWDSVRSHTGFGSKSQCESVQRLEKNMRRCLSC